MWHLRAEHQSTLVTSKGFVAIAPGCRSALHERHRVAIHWRYQGISSLVASLAVGSSKTFTPGSCSITSCAVAGFVPASAGVSVFGSKAPLASFTIHLWTTKFGPCVL